MDDRHPDNRFIIQYNAVNLIIDHLEYLLRRHDCVTVPGVGALMVRHRPAMFDSRNPLVLLPPSRELVFNGALVESDGIIEASVSRRNGVSFEAAARIVSEEADSLCHQLKDFGTLMLGHLGELVYTGYGAIMFKPAAVSGWDYNYYGLQPLYLRNADNVVRMPSGAVHALKEEVASVTLPVSSIPQRCGDFSGDGMQEEQKPGRMTRAFVGVAASLAVIVTLALFFLNPIKIDNEPLKASIAPVDEAHAEPVENVEGCTSAETSSVSAEDPAAVQTVECPAQNVVLSKPRSDAADVVDTAAKTAKGEHEGQKTSVAPRFNAADPFCVIVASFPEESQASQYLSENRGRMLGVLQQDGKYRVYAATGATYEDATAQKQMVEAHGAWICRR